MCRFGIGSLNPLSDEDFDFVDLPSSVFEFFESVFLAFLAVVFLPSLDEVFVSESSLGVLFSAYKK